MLRQMLSLKHDAPNGAFHRKKKSYLNKSKSSPQYQEEGKEGRRRLTLRNDVATSHSYDISMCQIAEVTRAKVISRARTVPTAEKVR